MVARKVKRTDISPSGLLYFPAFMPAAEEQQLIKLFDSLDFYDFVLQGYAARRKVRHYGYSYEFYSPSVRKIEPFPDWLNDLRDRAASLAELQPDKLEQALITRYPAGAGIGWHRDAPAFGPVVIGISLASDAIMRFRRLVGGSFEMYKQPLARRSLYILSGAARSVWQHSLPPAEELRYSITFRTVREQYRSEPSPSPRTA